MVVLSRDKYTRYVDFCAELRQMAKKSAQPLFRVNLRAFRSKSPSETAQTLSYQENKLNIQLEEYLGNLRGGFSNGMRRLTRKSGWALF